MPLPDPGPALKRVTLATGVHARWLSLLFFGTWKTGKSFALSSFPKPLVVVDCGDGGIAQYFAKDDPDVEVFSSTHPDIFEKALNYAIKYQDQVSSFLIDPITEQWTDHADFWQEQLGGEIKGGGWSKVKGPWKRNLRRMKRAPFHVGSAAWLKDIEYTTEAAPPGVTGKLVINQQAVPATEKTVPYGVDLIFETNVLKDRLNRPTPIHTITFFGGRRPHSVAPDMLHVGKQWKFDARKPSSVWDTIITPMLPDWENGAVDYVGPIDGREATNELAEMREAGDNHEAGRLLRTINDATDPAVYKTHTWPTIIEPGLHLLSTEDARKAVRLAHEAKKKELGL